MNTVRRRCGRLSYRRRRARAAARPIAAASASMKTPAARIGSGSLPPAARTNHKPTTANVAAMRASAYPNHARIRVLACPHGAPVTHRGVVELGAVDHHVRVGSQVLLGAWAAGAGRGRRRNGERERRRRAARLHHSRGRRDDPGRAPADRESKRLDFRRPRLTVQVEDSFPS